MTYLEKIAEENIDNCPPEVAYRFLLKHMENYPGVEASLKKAALLPGVTPEMITDILAEFSLPKGYKMPPGCKKFTIKALEHLQFLAQVEAGTHEGEKGPDLI